MDDCDHSKVFVGGISWETTEDTLRDHFSNYGTVVGSVIAKERATSRPRGFAFVLFSDASVLDRVLADTHTILGRTVEVKKAVPRSEQNQNPQEQNRGQNSTFRNNGPKTNDTLKTKKIFVGGLSANLTENDFKFYFEKFGRITDVVVMHDNVTHRPRGFGFITFDSEDSVEQVMQKSFHELCGKLVEVKRAVPKEVSGSVSSGIRDSNFSGGYQQAGLYRPRFNAVPSYGLFPSYGGYGYPYGGGYGMAAAVPPRVPWGGPVPVYPGYLNGGHGLMGMMSNGYNGIVGPAPSGMPSQLSGGVDNSYLGSSGGEARRNDQSGVGDNID
ncbi:heterogeneous nuclear ribonucleoprotein 1-like [Bidens hawaiensis]|uniref:heterogeneous nuclear ribonucleoprotein 1-like n=1 Tax=Bidens hawaiensis TaxID=980011 RepID=UPI00404ABCE1